MPKKNLFNRLRKNGVQSKSISLSQYRNDMQRAYVKGYGDAGASWTKRALKGFTAKSGAPIEDIDINNKTLRQRGRILYMASPVAAAAINTNRTKIVGPGLHMRCSINRDVLGLSETAAKEWQRTTEAEWNMWADSAANCDALGMNNFYELQQMVLKAWLMSGDVFALFKRYEKEPWNPYTLRLYLIEADRVSTPKTVSLSSFPVNSTEGENSSNKNKIHDGIEVDSNGRVVAYHISKTYPDQLTKLPVDNWVRVEARGKLTGLPNVLHIMDAERPDQYRGVSYLAPVIETLLQLRRYTESELTAALVQSYLTAWITTETNPADFPFNEVGVGEIDYGEGVGSQINDVSHSENEYEMGPGQINHLAPGESVTLGNPNVPTAGFENFVKTICQMVGAGLEVPYDVLMKEFNASYSASKGALEEMWETAKMRRSWFVSDFCQPTYETWLAEAVAIGRIKAPGFFDNPLIRAAWCGARWDGPAQTHLDPVKEATANEILVKHGWKSNEQITREQYGSNWEDNAEIIRQENKVFAPETDTSNASSAGTSNEPDDGAGKE